MRPIWPKIGNVTLKSSSCECANCSQGSIFLLQFIYGNLFIDYQHILTTLFGLAKRKGVFEHSQITQIKVHPAYHPGI